MPLNLIPNQPFIFESPLYAQDCLNNDTLEYSQMVQPDDTICVQQKITPCDEAINCDSDMFDPQGNVILSPASWTAGTGWTASGTTISYTGTGSSAGLCSLAFTLNMGRAYRLWIKITTLTTDLIVNFGSSQTTTITETGEHILYYIAENDTGIGDTTVAFGTDGSSDDPSDQIVIDTSEVFALQQITNDCWYDSAAEADGAATWSYDNTGDGLTIQGDSKFCSTASYYSELVNTTAYTNDGNYHRVNVTVSDCTEGYVEVVLGGVYLGATSGNGDFVFYGIPTDASGELRFVKRDSFDGCLSNCTVDEFGVVDNTDPGNSVYKLYVANDSGVATTDELSFEVFEDRVTWCFNVSELENGGNPIELGCDIIYRLLLTEQCLEEDLTSYVSVTTLRYNPDGWDCTKVFDASCEGYAFGFYFGSTTATTFRLIQRLRVLQFAPRYPAEGEEYLYSSGVSARQYAQSGKIRTAWFDYCDEATHDVIRLQVLCDIATIDDIQVFCPVKDYEPEWDEHRRNLAQSKVDMQLVSEVAVFKRNC